MWLLPILSGLSRTAVRIFYRVQVAGPEVPATGPVVLFANHPNSLLDPALVAAAAARPVRFLAKSTLFSHPQVGWLVRAAGAIPVYRPVDDAQAAARNFDMFAAVYGELAAGAAIGIFPEGISHSASSLGQLRTGTARIALGALPVAGVCPLVPVGLVLRDKGVYRSEALILRGQTVAWEDLAPRGVDDREAVAELTERLERGLREVTLNLERWQDQPVVECAVAVWSAEHGPQSDEVERVRLSQVAAEALADLRHGGEPDWAELVRVLDRHRRRLAVLGLEPSDLHARVDAMSSAGWLLRRLPLLGPPLVLVGLLSWIVFWPPYWSTDRIVGRMQPAPDQRSTHKVLVGAAAYLLWILTLGVATWWLIGGWWAGLFGMIVLPGLGLGGLWVRERWHGAWKDARRFVLLHSRADVRRQLQSEQARLAARLAEALETWRERDKVG